jgi:hypothetical protein
MVPGIVHDVVLAVASSGITTTVYQLLKTWVEARNGRRLKLKMGDIEVEASQIPEKDVLRIFDLLQEKADRRNIRELLLEVQTRKKAPTITHVS